jgi:hypothetical protein
MKLKSFACRLRAAGVSAEDRAALLGHAEHSMSQHFASADVGRCSSSPIWFCTAPKHAPCCESPTADSKGSRFG